MSEILEKCNLSCRIGLVAGASITRSAATSTTSAPLRHRHDDAQPILHYRARDRLTLTCAEPEYRCATVWGGAHPRHPPRLRLVRARALRGPADHWRATRLPPSRNHSARCTPGARLGDSIRRAGRRQHREGHFGRLKVTSPKHTTTAYLFRFALCITLPHPAAPSDSQAAVAHLGWIVTGRDSRHGPQPNRPPETNRLS